MAGQQSKRIAGQSLTGDYTISTLSGLMRSRLAEATRPGTISDPAMPKEGATLKGDYRPEHIIRQIQVNVQLTTGNSHSDAEGDQ